jgi:hypothetical protein
MLVQNQRAIGKAGAGTSETGAGEDAETEAGIGTGKRSSIRMQEERSTLVCQEK